MGCSVSCKAAIGCSSPSQYRPHTGQTCRSIAGAGLLLVISSLDSFIVRTFQVYQHWSARILACGAPALAGLSYSRSNAGSDAREPQARMPALLRTLLRTEPTFLHQRFDLWIAAAEVAIGFRRV